MNRGNASASSYRASTVWAKYMGTDASTDARADRTAGASTCAALMVLITVYIPRW